jgi:hypothetical protein
MKGDIDRDFYCSAGADTGSVICPKRFSGGEDGLYCADCKNRLRKWPTLEQFREEYGGEYPEDGAVYCFDSGGGFDNGISKAWGACRLSIARMYESLPHELGRKFYIVCACTPWGKPPDDWRPE